MSFPVMRYVSSCFCLFGLLALSTAFVRAQSDKIVLGYFPSWSQYGSGSADGVPCRYTIDDVDASLFTHINFAFANVGWNNEIVTGDWNDEASFQVLRQYKNYYPQLKTLISVGGQGFAEMSTSSSSRATFINSVIAFCRTHGFDGVDIDWEFPTYSQRQLFTTLMRDFRERFDAEAASTSRPRLLLTIASPGGRYFWINFELDIIHQYLDFFNIMTYDLKGGWDSVTGCHTQLYSPSSDGTDVDHAVSYYLSQGVPPSKIVIGLATYGHSWTLASSGNHGIGAPAVGGGNPMACTGSYGFLSWIEIEEMKNTGGNSVFDDLRKVEYVWKGNQWVCHDTPQTIVYKTDYIKERNLGGGMTWALSYDPNHDIFAVIARELMNPADPDQCPSDPEKTSPGVCGCGVSDQDSDNDGTPDCTDDCPYDSNKVSPDICGCGVSDQDSDNDGTPDCTDDCPYDSFKVSPGICGCGVTDQDSDSDGTPDCIDDCPYDSNKVSPGVCGCGVSDQDSDGDGIPDCIDDCPYDSNKVSPGVCGCDAVESDLDDDGVPDCTDECPQDPNKLLPGLCGCGVEDRDSDNDGVPDCNDECPIDPEKTSPGICGCCLPETENCGAVVSTAEETSANDPIQTVAVDSTSIVSNETFTTEEEDDPYLCHILKSACHTQFVQCVSSIDQLDHVCICLNIWMKCLGEGGCLDVNAALLEELRQCTNCDNLDAVSSSSTTGYYHVLTLFFVVVLNFCRFV